MTSRVIAALVLLIVSGSVSSGVFGPSNFEECVLDKMKGQLPAMRPTASKACERDFERAVDISLVEFAWAAEGTVNIRKNQSDFAITRAVFSFSHVACDRAKENDYSTRAEVTFAGWVPGMAPKTSGSFAFAEPTNPATLQCMRTDEVYGKRIR